MIHAVTGIVAPKDSSRLLTGQFIFLLFHKSILAYNEAMENYIFDFYGTLVDIWTNERKKSLWDSFSADLKIHGIHYYPAQLQKVYLKTCQQETLRMQQEHPDRLVEIDLKKVFAEIGLRKGVKLSSEDIVKLACRFRDYSTEKLELFTDTLSTLQALKDAGCHLYILSNAQAMFTDYEIDRFGLRPYFDGIFYSSDLGSRKPDQHFYNALFEKYKLDKNKSVMIGNDWHTDIMAAHHFGIRSFFYPTSTTNPKHAPLPPDCIQIQRLSDLIKKQ